MREIIHCQVGQCGNQIGSSFWESLCGEHGLDFDGQYHGDSDLQLDKINVYFNEAAGSSYVPRAVLADLDTGTMDSIWAGPLGSLLNQDNYCFAKRGGGGHWAIGHYTEGAELIDSVLDAIRKEAEIWDSLQGFQIDHSLGGVTGGGMGTLLLCKLCEEYPDLIVQTFSVMTSPKVSDTVLEPYSWVLSLHQLIENSGQSVILDNEALYNIWVNSQKIKSPTYKDLNKLITSAMVNTTATFRFESLKNSTIRDMAANLQPFPRMHFMTVGLSGLSGLSPLPPKGMCTIIPITQNRSLKDKYLLWDADPRYGIYLGAFSIYRGRSWNFELEPSDSDGKSSRCCSRVDWIPDNFMTSIVDTSEAESKGSATCIANSTSIQKVFKRIGTQFSIMFDRKAFLHHYCGEGIDEMEFIEAKSWLDELINDYQMYKNMGDEDEYEDAEELLDNEEDEYELQIIKH